MNEIQILTGHVACSYSIACNVQHCSDAGTSLHAGNCSFLGCSSVFVEKGSSVCSILCIEYSQGFGHVTSSILSNIPG